MSSPLYGSSPNRGTIATGMGVASARRGRSPAGMTTSTGRGRGAARLSPEGLAVLHACAGSHLRLAHCEEDVGGVGGCIYVADLVRLAPGRRAVARASLSRTLRRLWRAGCVELVNSYGYSLTAMHANADAEVQAAERDPQGTFAQAAAAPGLFLYATPEEYLAYLRERAAWLPRGRPVHVVQITSAGRERLTASQGEVNRKPRSPVEALPPVIDEPPIARPRVQTLLGG